MLGGYPYGIPGWSGYAYGQSLYILGPFQKEPTNSPTTSPTRKITEEITVEKIPVWLWTSSAAGIVLLSIFLITVYKCKKNRDKQRLQQQTMNIYNPMVVTIAIGDYQRGLSRRQKEIKGHLEDLDGVRVDIATIDIEIKLTVCFQEF